MSQKISIFGVMAWVALTMAGCSSFPGSDPLAADSTVSVKPASIVAPIHPAAADPNDVVIGQREHPRILAAHGGIYRNQRMEAMLARMVGRLVAASDTPGLRFRITVLNSPSVNAFALPGGYLYITRGLIALSNDLSEVAAVVAHEMAHVTARHAIARARAVRTAKAAGQAIMESVRDPNDARAALAMNTLTIATFSRQQELEADYWGIALAARAGFDPLGSPRFLSSLARYSELQAGNLARFRNPSDLMATHPSTPQRVRRATAIARTTGLAGGGRREREHYLRSIEGLAYGDSPNDGFVRGNRYFHPDLDLTFSVPRSYSLHNSPMAVIAVAPDGNTMQLDNPPSARNMALVKYLRSGWIKGLIESSVRKHRFNGLPAAIAQARNGVWQYHIAIIDKDGTVYRLIYAAPSSSRNARQRFFEIVGSFRQLSDDERQSLRPLQLRIVRVGAGDSAKSLAARMRGFSSDNLKHFLALNGLRRASDVRPGMLVKIAE